VPETAREFTRAIVDGGGGSVVAVLLYGSQLQRSAPDRYSAWDLMVVVESYRKFHRAMFEAALQSRQPFLMNLLAPFLPPYVTAFDPPSMDSGMAKCLVLSEAHFLGTLGPRSRDHFVKGRFVQHVETVWTASPEHETRIAETLEGARRNVLVWAGPYLDEPFDAVSLTQRMLAVSFTAELRPETLHRSLEVWQSQQEWLERIYGGVLAEAEAEGLLQQDPGGGYRFARPIGWWHRTRVRIYFSLSNIRGTVRWAKHVITFNNWLPYLKRKAERRTGLTIELTPAEERWPLIFLWPKAIRILRYGRAHGPDEEPLT
jgi:hypothetical protein